MEVFDVNQPSVNAVNMAVVTAEFYPLRPLPTNRTDPQSQRGRSRLYSSVRRKYSLIFEAFTWEKSYVSPVSRRRSKLCR